MDKMVKYGIVIGIGIVISMAIGLLPNPITPIKTETVTSIIIDKIVFYPVFNIYYFKMDNGDTVSVGLGDFDRYQIGDEYTYTRRVTNG